MIDVNAMIMKEIENGYGDANAQAKVCQDLILKAIATSRYKDIYDIYYLLQHADDEKLKKCLATFIFDDPGMRENDAKGIYRRINMVFKDKVYRRNLATRDANWLGVDTSVVINGILKFIENIQ